MTFTAADCERCRRDFPSLARTFNGRPIAYLDGPAGTQVPEPVIEAMSDYYRTANANTHGEFPVSRDTDRLLHETRVAAAAFLGSPDWRSVIRRARSSSCPSRGAEPASRRTRPSTTSRSAGGARSSRR